jgi:predicted acetyltransferase
MGLNVRPMEERDRSRGFRVYADAYGAGPDTVAGLADASVENRWVVADDTDVLAIMRVLPVEQMYGGLPVTSTGVGAVAVALEARSRGMSRMLMSGFLRAEHNSGLPLSILYMSTIAAYRPHGYELAGSRVRYQFPLEHLPRQQPLRVTPWQDDDLDDVDACLRRISAMHNGLMIRPRWWWAQRVFGQLEDSQYLYRYRVVEDGRTTGFLVYTTKSEHRADFPVHWVEEPDCVAIVTRDLFWETAAAGRSLLGFLAAQRTVGTNVYWSGPPNDPTMAFIPEHLPRTQAAYQWMNRLVHVGNALEGRGYAPDLRIDVSFEVVDDVVPGNAGGYRFAVEGGHGRVERLDAAPLRITVGALAAIYTGWWTPATAAAAGHITGASDRDLAALEATFAGPQPWLNEFF